MAKPSRRPEDVDPVAAYKERLAAIIERRPSGTRQRLADALGKHRSFVTQITSASYPTSLPERHLATIFAVCHFSAEERRLFLEEYFAAHPERAGGVADGRRMRHVALMVPDLGSDERNRRFDEAIADMAHRMAALVAEEEAADAQAR